MNEVFNIKRFGRYAARNFGVNRKKYLIGAASLLAFMIIAFLFKWVTVGKDLSAPIIGDLGLFYFRVVLLFTTVIFGINVMAPFKNRHSLVVENTVPASTTEKFLFVLLTTTVLSFAVFLLSLLVTALLGIALTGVGTLKDYFMAKDGYSWIFVIWLALPLQAITLYTGTMERRNHMVSLLLVVVTVVAAIFLFGAGPMLMSERFDTDIEYGPMFASFGDSVESANASVNYSSASRLDGPAFAHILSAATTLVFWVAAWFNLRERSVK